MKLISIIVPMYNEEEGIHNFFKELDKNINKITRKQKYQFEIVVINDGSSDNTYKILEDLKATRTDLVLVNLSRNFGHECAVAAGLSVAHGDAVIPMDADLQDPPELIEKLIEKYEEGYDVVNAKRESRDGETKFKIATANIFYKLISKWSGKVKVPQNVGHFRLISRRVVDQVVSLKDYVRVFRVEVPYVGFKTTEVLFKREERTAGETHYNIDAMTTLALDSIISTTTKPLRITRLITGITFIAFILSLIATCCLIGIKYGTEIPIEGLLIITIFIVNIILLMFFLLFCILTLMSEYQARIFLESQDRPFFIIESVK